MCNHCSLFKNGAQARLQVFCGQAYNAKADVYASAITILELISGKHLSSQFLCEKDAYIYAQRMAAGHRPKVPDRFPPALAALLRAAWAQDPAERPTAAQLLQQLRAVAASAEWAKFCGHARGGGCLGCLRR